MNEPKKISIKPILIIGLIAIILMLALSAYAWMNVPEGEKLPVHWGLDGQPDRYGSKMEAFLLMPLICIGLTALFCGIPYMEPRKLNLESSKKAYYTIIFMLLLFLLGIHCVTTLSALGRKIEINSVIPFGVGILFLVIGNYMGKIRSNFFCGIRTPWTLSSELSWNKTHRLGGKLFMIMGILVLVSPFIKGGGFTPWIILAGALGMTSTVFVYSYIVWRNDPDKQQSGR